MHKTQYGFLLSLSLISCLLHARTNEDAIQTLDPYIVLSGTVANESPLPTYSNPISLLSFGPGVDVQSRNFSEAQGDISIRGGVFENTGFNVGTLSVFDPQTGHYLAELPIDPMMLDRPEINTGHANNISAFNATVGSVNYLWQPVSINQSFLNLSLGENNLNTQSVYSAFQLPRKDGHAFVDFGLSRSESDGTVPFGDHDFKRFSARYSYTGATSRFTFFGGYQDKFFGWPNMYTPFNVQETEDIQTLLLMSEYSVDLDTETTLTLSGYYRENHDDYEFDRDRPGLYNPYEHTTQVSAVHGEIRRQLPNENNYYLIADLFFDSIESTTLTNAFQSRTYGKIQAGGVITTLADNFDVEINLSLNDTNRDAAMLNPSIRLEYTPTQADSAGSSLWYLEYSRSTQVSGYTAIGSPVNGLFAGNPNLGVERNHNFEIGMQHTRSNLAFRIATFFRMDRDLTDWTFSYASSNARTANPVDIDTFGIETLMTRQWNSGWISLGYTFLRKEEDYASSTVDASFYALNFPKHRATLSLAYQLFDHLELRIDNEYRIQEENALRQSADHALLTYVSLIYTPLNEIAWDLRISVDNLWDEAFEEIPAVPASRRQFALQSTYSW